MVVALHAVPKTVTPRHPTDDFRIPHRDEARTEPPSQRRHTRRRSLFGPHAALLGRHATNIQRLLGAIRRSRPGNEKAVETRGPHPRRATSRQHDARRRRLETHRLGHAPGRTTRTRSLEPRSWRRIHHRRIHRRNTHDATAVDARPISPSMGPSRHRRLRQPISRTALRQLRRPEVLG